MMYAMFDCIVRRFLLQNFFECSIRMHININILPNMSEQSIAVEILHLQIVVGLMSFFVKKKPVLSKKARDLKYLTGNSEDHA